MRRSALLLAVVCDLILLGSAAAATRPQYGGSLRVSTWTSTGSLDPAGASVPSNPWNGNMALLFADTLVRLDDAGRLVPALATSWNSDPGNQRWEFFLRSGVRFQDGTLFAPEVAAASLRAVNSAWKVIASQNSIVFQLAAPERNLPALLAQSRYAILKRNSSGDVVGTGPFRITSWSPGKHLAVSANDDYWNGRPFLDSLDITMGVSSRDQLVALELGRVDIVELEPEQANRAAAEGFRTMQSSPSRLVALLFTRDAAEADLPLREALSLAIDRASLCQIFLHGTGEPTGALLPTWVSGYSFVFRPEFNVSAAREKRVATGRSPSWSLSFDPSDPMARVLAERVALNAQDAGLSLHASTTLNADLRLVTVAFTSMIPSVAFGDEVRQFGLPDPSSPLSTAQDLYQAESAILQTRRVVPLFFLPTTYTLAPAVQGWNQSRLGTWHAENLWLSGKMR